MCIKGDFHMHSSSSDGKLTPSELVKCAKEHNISYISLTDHDTVSGLHEAIHTGKTEGIVVIPGIELTTMYNDDSIHILGYFKDEGYESSSLTEFLNNLKIHRANRAKKIVENLKYYFNLDVNYELVIKNANNVIARPHIAKAIMDSGYNFDWDYIFNNFLSKDSPAYVNNMEVSVAEGISILKKHNALTVLAHPVLIKKTSIEDLLKFDFDGIEAIYYSNTPEQTLRLINLSERNNKIITAGSDFHGHMNDNSHGRLGSVFLSDSKLNSFLQKVMP